MHHCQHESRNLTPIWGRHINRITTMSAIFLILFTALSMLQFVHRRVWVLVEWVGIVVFFLYRRLYENWMCGIASQTDELRFQWEEVVECYVKVKLQIWMRTTMSAWRFQWWCFLSYQVKEKLGIDFNELLKFLKETFWA